MSSREPGNSNTAKKGGAVVPGPPVVWEVLAVGGVDQARRADHCGNHSMVITTSSRTASAVFVQKPFERGRAEKASAAAYR